MKTCIDPENHLIINLSYCISINIIIVSVNEEIVLWIIMGKKARIKEKLNNPGIGRMTFTFHNAPVIELRIKQR